MQGIYEVVNLSDGKATAYVGSSRDIEGRWRTHHHCLRRGTHPNAHLQHAWDKYGEDAFVFSILEEVKESDRLLAVEQEYLSRYLGWGSCYNIAHDAVAPMKGHEHTEGTKHKIGEANKGKVLSEQTKRRMSRAKQGYSVGKGVPKSPEHRRNISEALRGRAPSEDCVHKAATAHAKPYPAFIHQGTGEIIPAGSNLSKLCRERGLDPRNMWRMMRGEAISCKGWVLA